MKKSKSKLSLVNLIMIMATVVLAVMSFVSMSFKFITRSGEVLGFGGSSDVAFSDWMESVAESNLESYDVWKTARIFMIIMLVLVAVLAVATLLKLLFKGNGVLNMCIQILALLTLVCAVVFIILMYVGANNLNQDVDFASYTYTISAGAWCMAIFSALASVTGFLSVRK